MSEICPRCSSLNPNEARFCNRCGMQFKPIPNVQPQKRKNSLLLPLIIIGTVLGLCGLCGMIGALNDATNGNKNSVVVQTTPTPLASTTALSLTSVTPVTVSPTPLPKTPSELLSSAKTLLGNGSLSGKEEAYRYLQAIPKSAKEYKQAKSLIAMQTQAKDSSGITASKTPDSDAKIRDYSSSPSGFVSRKPYRETSPTAPKSSGASAKCRDGTLSYSQNRRGTCSHHGGVAEWY